MSEETPPDIPFIWAQLCHKDQRIRESALREAKKLSEREVVLLYRYGVAFNTIPKEPVAFKAFRIFLWLGAIASLGVMMYSLPLGLIWGSCFIFVFYCGLRMTPEDKKVATAPALMSLMELIPTQPETPEILEMILFYKEVLPLRLALTTETSETIPNHVAARFHTSLKEALPLLNQEVADRIRKHQRKAFYALLEKPYQDTELTLRILHAIPYFADEEALAYVAPLMAEGKATQNMQRISYAARLCYSQLKEAIAERKESNLLLRPSSGNADEVQTLLRPSEENPEDKRDLLRPQL